MAKKSKKDEKNEEGSDQEENSKEEDVNEESKNDSEQSKEEIDEEEEEEKHRLESFRKAGQIHNKVIEFIKPKIKVGSMCLEICSEVEEKIKELEGEIGFPTNISINDVACHYTSPPEDEREIEEGDVVKVDIGVAIDGFVADGAFTVSFNDDPKLDNLLTAVETAVLKGLSE